MAAVAANARAARSVPSVLAIAGSDSSGGAGVQADIKTIAAHHLYAQSAITALTAQNTLGVAGVLPVPASFIEAQIDAVFQDIRPDAVKIGMLSSAEAVRAVAAALRRNGAENIVLDPVMVATSGADLSTDESVAALAECLLPLASVVTPNLPEALVLAGADAMAPAGLAHSEREALGRAIVRRGARAVLVKGGHAAADADDVLVGADGAVRWYAGARVNTPNTHGTGCTLSSAVACGLAQGLSLGESVDRAKRYLAGALAAGLSLGRGSGPVDHMWNNRIAG